ncbi:SDR family oxidoreductase [Streptomyces hyaluromycini]|uniref:SDR family oxidoreductase n=1 Tax=Streptomyces hyaluromycini TaxID=1377993 RepID=A0ABV1X9Q2_9ACTN
MTAPAPVRTPLPAALAGQHVLILGGSSGIGLAAARLLAGAGARLSLVARDETRLKAAVGTLPDGTAVTALTADATDEDRLVEVFRQAGPLDHVLVTAGAASRTPLAETDRCRVRDAFDVRFWGGYSTARIAAGQLPAGGSITLMSGVYTVRPVAGAAAAIASGAACEGLTRALAVELAPQRVRVNAVRSGVVDTPPLRRRLHVSDADPAEADAAVAAAGSHLPLGRFGTAEEAAAAALFVMANPYVTGSVVTVDGGQSLA